MFSSYPNTNHTLHLSREHRHMLEHESGIDPGVAAERGYQTIRKRAELLDFKKYQRRAPALRAPMYSPDGETTAAQIRPDTPRKGKNGKPIKYETAAGSEVILDVHPRMRTEVNSGDGDLWITEGIKKADSLTSRGLPTIGIIGVWNWQRGGELLPCWQHVRLEGRRVHIVYDADVMVNPNVQLALQRLVVALEARGADVYVVYLPDLGDGKTGVDDYLAAGHTVAELKMLARTFEPADIGNVRMAADAGLRDAVDTAWSSWRAFDWNRLVGAGDRPHWMRGHSARDVEKVAIDTATKSGVAVEDGIYFSLNARSWAEAAASRKQTVLNSIDHLEAEGRIRRYKAEREEGKAAGYVLLTARASPYQKGERESGRGRIDSLHSVGSDPTGTDLRAPVCPTAPRLRWSAPKFTRNPDGGWDRDYIRRLGKHNGAIVDHLEGGGLDIAELAEITNKRARDLRRRNLPLLEERGIISVEGDTVRLVSNWIHALEEERRISGELEAAERDRTRHKTQREAFRNRHKHPADSSPTEADMDAAREERERRYRADKERPVSPLAEAMRAYLERNPHHADEPAGWIGSTLWAYSLYDGKPTPAESKAALAELGGNQFLERVTRMEVAA